MEIEEETNIIQRAVVPQKIPQQFRNIRSKRDYILLKKNAKNINICYFDHVVSKTLLNLVSIERLKLSAYCSDKQKFKDLMDLLILILKKYPIKELSIDFSKFQQMTDNDLQSLSFALMQNPHILESLSINLNHWGQENEQITSLGCQYLGVMFTKQTQLKELSLQCVKWGLNNTKINDQAVKYICSGIQQCENLTKLEINFQTWGCKKYSSLELITNSSVKYVSQMIQNLTQLESLDLNLRSWAYSNSKVNNQALVSLSKMVPALKKLSKINLNLYCWGYENANINESGLETLIRSLSGNRDIIESLYINLDGWASDFKNETSIQTVSDKIVCSMFSKFSDFSRLNSFSLNLSSWGWKNNKITDQSLKAVGIFLSKRGAFLDVLELNFKVWWNFVQQISENGISYLAKGLNSCENLRKLDLNLESMGYKNESLNNISIQLIGNSLQNIPHLEELHLNLECWGVEDTETYGFICDQDIVNLINPINNMKKIKVLSLNLNSWGYKNNKITDQSIDVICETLETHANHLTNLILKLRYWGYNNSNMSDKSLLRLQKCFNQLNQIQELQMDIDSWGDGNIKITYQQLSEMLNEILQMKYLSNFQIEHSLQDWYQNANNPSEYNTKVVKNKCDLLLSFIGQKILEKKNLMLQEGAIQQQYAHRFRRELLYDIGEVFV